MVVLSKLVEASFPFTCYEIAHPWNPSCTASWVTLYGSTFKNSFKIYGVLYLVAQLVGRKISPKAFLDTFSSTVRSASFLSYNVFYFMFFICALRWTFGRLYLQNSTFVAGLLSGFFSILVERRSRRRVLSVYMLNQCSEIIFNMLESRNKVRRIPNGEVYMFAVSLAFFLFFMSMKRDLRDPISYVLRHLMGKEEFSRSNTTQSITDTGHCSCPHSTSCLHNIAKGFAIPFLAGYGIRSLLYLVSRRGPFWESLRKALTNSSHLGQGLFLGGTVAIFRACKCALRRISGRERDWHSLVGGLLGGLCMAACPNSSLALYLTWKLIEVLYCHAASLGYAPTVPLGSEMLFGFSCGVMMFCAVVEPHNMRSSYAKFINDVTGDKLRQVNRHPLEILGYHCSSIYPDYFPQLDHHHVSKTFVERVLIWS
ncbi:transmembrane protein 135-like [Ornithodoros turicata]|uniref:transmembrane protein 135-like n=1 Tax=Ornithodoros turicata TaxID=34597 RepID=UPI0031394E68